MRTFILSLFPAFLFSLTMAQTPKKEYNLLIGTYTNESKTNGIHVYRFDTQTGEFSEKSKTTEVVNPSYLAVSRDRKNVYAVSEVAESKGGVYAFSFDPKTGKLIPLNNTLSGGDHPCYVSVDDKKKCVVVGNYSSGTLSAIRVKDDGSFNTDIQTVRHEGGSVNKSQQEKPHVHATVLSPDNKYLFVPDLGGDKVYSYRLDVTNAKPLTPNTPPYVAVKVGSGPRHLIFHPNGKLAFLITELDASITAYDYKNGKLEAKQTITMLSPDFKGDVGAADIHLSPDGNFLYGSNRGDANEIVIYSLDKSSKLTYAGRQSTLGKTPRNFEIDPTGNFLLAANQNSNDVIIFKRDLRTGLLTDTGKKIVLDKPVCVKFVAVE
jgi:6-phosphogluconolactonase